ncbi:trypsin-like serine peptidase [Rhodosalinus sp.]|uniref:trypsin-like serine peptidase n=1 Tax=Rhodosalinus sp. TaxID=2047741 RepID=UPI003566897D
MRRLLLTLVCLTAGAGWADELPDPLADGELRAALGRMNVAGYASRSQCSGTLVAPDLVLTAAHCVTRSDGTAHRLSDLHFVAGWNRGDYAGHGRVEEVILHPAWQGADTGDFTGDIALARLDAPLKVRPLTAARPAVAPVPRALAGYAWHRPHAPIAQTPCRARARGKHSILLTCPAEPGISGGPLVERDGEGWRVVGVVAGTARADGATATLAVPLGARLLDLIDAGP